MTTPDQTVDESAFEPFIDTPPAEPAILCESCGTARADKLLADLVEQDTTLYCGPCLVLTMARVAMEIGATE